MEIGVRRSMNRIFLSTLSLRRATCAAALFVRRFPYFYPRSPCGERLYTAILLRTSYSKFLSTLSLRRATPKGPLWAVPVRFLSTLSLRRATVRYLQASPGGYYFYPRSPCGERRVFYVNILASQVISIHALLAESDVRCS